MISPLENSGIISRSQDISIIQNNTVNHEMHEHVTIQQRFQNASDEKATTVKSADNSDSTDTHHDAREKGRNEYIDMRRKDTKKPKTVDKVITKGRQGFDISI